TDRIFNITDAECVSRRTFVETVADLAGLPRPHRSSPKKVGWFLANGCDRIGRMLHFSEPPALSKARYKFLALNLEFSTQRARTQLGYRPPQDFPSGMTEAVRWYQEQQTNSGGRR